MVPALELTDEEVLERLQKMLKGVSVVPHAVIEYCANNPPPAVTEFSANNPPPAVSCLSFCLSTLCTLAASILA